MALKYSNLRLLRFSTRTLERERDFGVSNVERVQKWLVMKKRRVINIEHDFADGREGVAPVLITKNANITRDQPPKRIESEMPDRRFDTAPMQFLDDPCASARAKTFSGHVPAAANYRRDGEHDREPQDGNRQTPRKSRLSILR